MECSTSVIVVVLIGLLNFQNAQVNCDWLAGTVDSLSKNARHLISGGNQVMHLMEKEIRNKRSIFGEATPGEVDFFRENLKACANLTFTLAHGETLLVAGGVLFYDADNDFNRIIGCDSTSSSYDCWSDIIDKLPDFMEKYKPITACYINNVYYTIEQIEYFFEVCIGNKPNPPKPPPETFEKCIKDMK